MYNDFILTGPHNDPASAAQAANIADAFKIIYRSNSKFISRGDDSGTFAREMEIWASAGYKPDYPGYADIGSGMGAAITMAVETDAYILSDRATFLMHRAAAALSIIHEGDINLLNRYSAISVNAARHAHVNAGAAGVFLNYLVSDTARNIIDEHRKDGYQLFFSIHPESAVN